MNKTTLTIMSLAAAMTVFACAKKDHKSPLEPANPKVDSPATVDANKSLAATVLAGSQKPTMANQAAGAGIPVGATRPSLTPKQIDYALTETFQGSVVTLAYPNDANWGMIQLDDDDAKALFNAMRVKTAPTEKNEKYTAGLTKTGQNIRCYKGAEIKTPQVEQYSCSLFLDYKAGSLNSLAFKIELDKEVPTLKQQFSGHLVELHANSQGTIRFGGLDARAMFAALSAPSEHFNDDESSKAVLAKSGKNIACSKTLSSNDPKKDVFECSLGINYATGTALEIKHDSPFSDLDVTK